MTSHWEILPFARVFAGDIGESAYTDDTILTVLRVTTGVVQILGYDKGHTSDPDGVSPNLLETEKALWGKAAAVLLQDPKAMEAALDAVAVRTLGTSYSTESRARFMEVATSKAFAQLSRMIRALSNSVVSSRDHLDIDTLEIDASVDTIP